jgi:hypothetical protein
MTDSTLPVIPSRSCSECRLCCRILAVYELKKPRGEWCGHACEKGCGIYETRPQSCRDFACFWLQGMFEESERPDKTKVVFTKASDETDTQVRHPKTGQLTPVVACHESYTGTADSPIVRREIKRLNSMGVSVVVNTVDRCRQIVFTDGHVHDVPADSTDAKLSKPSWIKD